MKNIFVSSNPVKTEPIPIEKIKTEDIDISEDEEDDLEDVQNLILALNPDIDSSDDENEKDISNTTLDELIPSQEIKVETSGDTEINNEENLKDSGKENYDDDDGGDDDVQSQLLMSDSEEDDDDGNMASPITYDTPIDPSERVEEYLKNQSIQDSLMTEKELSNYEEENNDVG